MTHYPAIRPLAALALAAAFLSLPALSQETEYRSLFGPRTAASEAAPTSVAIPRPNKVDQSKAAQMAKSRGCIDCHENSHDPHGSEFVRLGCTDCHGGDATPGLTMRQAHVEPRNPVFFESSANPSDSTVLLNHESEEFIQFVNPGDLRVAKKTCGDCHAKEVDNVGHSMMRHGAMLWGAAAYNNGAFPAKDSIFGQAYGANGAPLALKSPFKYPKEEMKKMGIVDEIFPLPRFNVGQTGNIYRIFEKGGTRLLDLGNPDPFDPPGRPLRRLGERGLGTLSRVDPVIIGAHKTRLHDPLLDFFGSNDRAGDYRSSGCTACHVVYANDRSPSNSGWYSAYGNQGLSFNPDPMISKKEKGHPIEHKFTRSIPSSQCMTCHMHQGNLFVNPYLGYTWWDQESDAEHMYPKKQKYPTDGEMVESLRKNPEAAAARGLWGDVNFLEKVAELNPRLKDTQFADYHGHGWVFRAIFKKDREGNLLTKSGEKIAHGDKDKFKKAVHMKDIHLALGMQCVDCHFLNDVHGNGLLYVEPRAATAITCVDCHGTANARPSLVTSGTGGELTKDGKVVPIDLKESNTPFGPRFRWDGDRLYQQSSMEKGLVWEIPQTLDTVDPGSQHYNAMSAYAKTLNRDGKSWGGVPDDPKKCRQQLAHSNEAMDCQTCHTAWATSCFGCHIPMEANYKMAANKFEGTTTRNYSSYNPQVVRDDVFMLGKDSTVKGNRLAVLRSSSAMLVGSQGSNREWFYTQQQTVSSEGYSGQAFNPHFAHTTSGVGTTKNCTDCHISDTNDNNAIMTQLLGFGTGTVNFFGRFAFVGTDHHGLSGVAWTERSEPQAAIGSHLHRYAYPDFHQKHLDGNSILDTSYHHPAKGGTVTDLQHRGEYLYAALGKKGFGIFDIANIDNKNFSERIIATPFSPLGHDTFFSTPYATSVALPSTLINDPKRKRLPENEEQPIASYHGYAFITDLEEGLIVTDVATMLDGNPDNNFIKKDVVFNPGGALDGARHANMAGQWIYITTDKGLAVVDAADPLSPQLACTYTGPALHGARQSAVQWRYLFVTDAEGVKVFDVSDPASPRPIAGASVSLGNANGLYAARTYLYAANGTQGLAMIDIKNPEKPRLIKNFDADGAINDARDVQIGSISASMYALVADGKNGMRVIQMISPENVPGHMGFSPVPNPKLIATYPTKAAALTISRGLDRDRVVDESGHQTVVFGRRGSRPFSLDEMKPFYQKASTGEYGTDSLERNGPVYKVADVKAGEDGALTDIHGKTLTPTEDFVSPMADEGEDEPYTGRLRRRRAPEDLR
ncbi:hypothetical protein HZ994_17475 [Akkermansiaceae bacterium]|nr:hypothetical protein HZ994_17475 [Akkermansiaceae bacterium]